MNAHDIVLKIRKVCKDKHIRWNIHDCSMCGCPVGYEFFDGEAYYDSNCDCVLYQSPLQYRSWEEVERTIEMNIDNPIVQSLLKKIGGLESGK